MTERITDPGPDPIVVTVSLMLMDSSMGGPKLTKDSLELKVDVAIEELSGDVIESS